jgi:hypothetical protein
LKTKIEAEYQQPLPSAKESSIVIESCPHCSARVWIEDGGRCPSCGQQTRVIHNPESPQERDRADVESGRPHDSSTAASSWETQPAAMEHASGSFEETSPCPMCGEAVPQSADQCDNCGEVLWEAAGLFGLWRDGKYLVMRKDAELPNRCVKSNRPTQRRLKRQLYWHFAAVYLAILICLPLYILLATLLSRRATVHIGLSEEWFTERHRAIIIGWCLTLGGIALFVAGFAPQNPGSAAMLWTGILLGVGGAIYGFLRSQMVSAKYIARGHVWLSGVHPDFLAELPEWPGWDGGGGFR